MYVEGHKRNYGKARDKDLKVPSHQRQRKTLRRLGCPCSVCVCVCNCVLEVGVWFELKAT